MPSTSADKRDPQTPYIARGESRSAGPTDRATSRHAPGRLAPLIGAIVWLAGCSELVIEGDVKDRETARPIPEVLIEQDRAGAWNALGRTDARGKYWILRDTVKDGRVRLSKSGYIPQVVRDNDFRNAQGYELIPTTSEREEF